MATKPFLPSDLRVRNSGQPLIRAIASFLQSQIDQSDTAFEVAKHNWPGDRDTELVLRAAVTPASITGSNWASTLAQTAIADFVSSMGGASAGSQALKRGIQLTFDSNAAIMVPGISASAASAGFVGEVAPIPVRALSVDGSTLLAPRKFATIAPFTREIFQRSVPTIETLVRTVLTESVALALDGALLDANAGDATRPPGLLNGISGSTKSADTNRVNAMLADLETLAAAVSGIGGGNPIFFIAAPAQAHFIKLWGGSNFTYEVFASSALTAGTVVCIATNALVSAVKPTPRFELADQAVLHMDSVPSQFSTVGSPNVVSAPLRSLWQTDAIGLRLVFDVAWALRNPGGLSWMSAVGW